MIRMCQLVQHHPGLTDCPCKKILGIGYLDAEAVTDGVNGRLAPPGDPSALAREMVALLLDTGAAKRMGKAGRARVEEFGAKEMVERIAQLYEELMSHKGIGR